LQQASQRLDYAQRALATPRAPLASLDARARALYARVHGAVLQSFAARRLALGRQREVLLRLRVTSGRGVPGESIARLGVQVARRRHAAAMRLAALEGRLEALDPLAVLKRGYAMAVASDGKVVTDAARLAVGESLSLRFARGAADVRVEALPTGDSTDEGNG
jgi:exodeoxyribonuclease VII large subunit